MLGQKPTARRPRHRLILGKFFRNRDALRRDGWISGDGGSAGNDAGIR